MIIKSYEILKNPSNFELYNLYLLYGENYGLKNDIKNKIIKNNTKEDKNIEIINFYENNIIDDVENFYNSIYSGSLFGNKKLININNVTDKIFKQVEDIIAKFPENTLLILFSNILEKKSKLRNFFEKNKNMLCIPCYPDSIKDLEIIAKTELKENSINISRESINILLEKSNSDRFYLKNEIEKIKAYATNKKNLDINEVKSIINFTGEYKSDSLVNECLCGNTLQYKKILTELYSYTVNQILILRILSNKIQRLLNMKEIEKKYNNLDGLLNASKPPIFWKEKPLVKKQLMVWNARDLKLIFGEINNIEILCKKNPQISKSIFFEFFNKICHKANNYS